MTGEELERACCAICGKGSRTWVEIYICNVGDEGVTVGKLTAKMVVCQTCIARQFGAPLEIEPKDFGVS